MTEARDPAGRFHPLPDRPGSAVPCDLCPAELLAALRTDLPRRTSGPLDDDAAPVAVRGDVPGPLT